MSFKNAIKGNVIVPYNKYGTNQEKIAEVLAIDEAKGRCDITYVNVDGIYTTTNNVPIKKNSKGVVTWFPEVGDKVEIQENGRRVIILGEYIKIDQEDDSNATYLDEYSDAINGTSGGFII
jgi:hypothetical protein